MTQDLLVTSGHDFGRVRLGHLYESSAAAAAERTCGMSGMTASEWRVDAVRVDERGLSQARGELAMKAMLVYQAGIANVFEVDCFNVRASGRELTRRVLQNDFRTCEAFARGMGRAGAIVRTAWCNMAGDIANCDWIEDLGSAPFSEQLHPVKCN